MTEQFVSGKDWAGIFFSASNQLNLEDEKKKNDSCLSWEQDVTPWLDFTDSDCLDNPICLPFVKSNQEVHWYFCSRSSQGANILREEISAFIGNSFGQFSKLAYELNQNVEHERLLSEKFSSPVLRITGTSPEQIKSIRDKIRLYQSIVRRRPRLSKNIARPFAQIRKEFDLALIAGNERGAREFLEEMKKTGRLTQQNLLFLEIRLMAGLKHWHQIILEEKLLHDLVNFQLPPSVVTDITEAYYSVYIAPYEEIGDLAQCLEGLKSSAITQLGLLFTNRFGVENTPVLKAFLFQELLQENNNKTYIFELLSKIKNFEKNKLLDAVSSYLSEEISEPIYDSESADLTDQELALDVYSNGQFDKATILFKKLPPSLEILPHLITCAWEEDDVDLKETIITFFSSMDENESKSLDAKIVKKIHSFENDLSASKDLDVLTDCGNATKGWLEWANFVYINNSDKVTCETILKKYKHKWDTANVTNDEGNSKAFSNLLGNASGDSEQVFRSQLPEILNAFVTESPQGHQNFKVIYHTLLFLMATSDNISSNELEIINQLVGMLFDFGQSPSEYTDTLDILIELIDGQCAAASIDWAIDLSELITYNRCSNQEAKLRYVMSLLDNVRKFTHRLDTRQKKSLILLFKDFELDAPEDIQVQEEDNSEDALSSKLAGLKIGIYTLTEQAGARAASILKGIAPTCEVVLNHDKECTERLRSLSKSADVFVFAWKSSKHQAFYCIKNHRTSTLPLLQPLGKGSSSILNEIIQFIE